MKDAASSVFPMPVLAVAAVLALLVVLGLMYTQKISKERRFNALIKTVETANLAYYNIGYKDFKAGKEPSFSPCSPTEDEKANEILNGTFYEKYMTGYREAEAGLPNVIEAYIEKSREVIERYEKLQKSLAQSVEMLESAKQSLTEAKQALGE